MPDEILTLPEVAQLLKVAEKTVSTRWHRRASSPLSRWEGSGDFSVSILIGGSSSRRRTPETREGAEMAAPHHRNPLNSFEAGLGLRLVACRISELSS
jgi:hypothetical protein